MIGSKIKVDNGKMGGGSKVALRRPEQSQTPHAVISGVRFPSPAPFLIILHFSPIFYASGLGTIDEHVGSLVASMDFCPYGLLSEEEWVGPTGFEPIKMTGAANLGS